MAEDFTLLKDSVDIPVCAFQIGSNALNQVLFAAVKVTDEVQTTDASGFFQCAHAPLLDIDGDGALTAADVLPRNDSTSAALFVGTAAADLDSNVGKFKLYSDSGLTTPVASTACKCTYYYAVPVSFDSSGRLILGASTQNIGDVDVLTEPATAVDNAAGLPAVIKVIGGYDGSNVQALKTDAAGELQVDVLTLPNVTIASKPGYSSLSVTVDTQIKGSAGKLRKVIVGKVTVAGDLTLYDSLAETGTVIATLGLETTGNPKELEFDTTFATGLYAGFDASLAGNITFMYE